VHVGEERRELVFFSRLCVEPLVPVPGPGPAVTRRIISEKSFATTRAGTATEKSPPPGPVNSQR